MRKIIIILLLICNINIISGATYSLHEYYEFGDYSYGSTIVWDNDTHDAKGWMSQTWEVRCQSGGDTSQWVRLWIYKYGDSDHYDEKTIHWSSDNIGEWITYYTTGRLYDEIFLKMMDHEMTYGNTGIAPDMSTSVKGTKGFFYPPDIDIFNIYGDVCGVHNCSLYMYFSDGYHEINSTTLISLGDTYNFEILNQSNYKLVFDNVYEFEFVCNGSDIEYNYDLCDYQILYYVDDCANLLKNPHIYIIKNDDWDNYLVSNGTSNTDVFLIGTDVELNDKLDIYIDTDQGTQHRTIYAEIGEDTLYHSFKSWNLGVTVYDINTSEYVSGAKVSVKQDCRINGYPCNTYGLTNSYGFVKTFDLSNQNYQVKVEKEGYNTFGWQTIYTNFDAQHTEYVLRVNLQDSTKGDGNGTVGDPDDPNDGDGTGGDSDDELPQTPCSIMWTDDNNKSISEINDSQDARLHYIAGNCSNLLYFEYYDTDTGMWEKIGDSTLLTAKEFGFKQYTPVNWTKDETTVYRGRLWAYSCGCDAVDQIKVWNISDENITIFDNLTANVFFRHKIGGQYINPNAPISIISYATSNNVSLMNIELKLFNESTEVDNVNYDVFTWWDGDSFNPAVWEPNYEYVAGFNYTVRMYGLNNALLDVDTVYANATGDNPFNTGNTLCIEVFDQNNMPLADSYVYIEGWDTKPTENDNNVCFSGLPDNTYHYRATKPAYQDRGFFTVDLTSDDTVSYILDKISDVHSVSDARLTNLQIKRLYLPLMYLLLIMILFGGLKYVSK